jgi:hypothetical protein
MFGPRLTRIFASRWNALWWAAGILFLAWQIVPSPDDDDQSPPAAHANADGNPWAMATATPKPTGEAR